MAKSLGGNRKDYEDRRELVLRLLSNNNKEMTIKELKEAAESYANAVILCDEAHVSMHNINLVFGARSRVTHIVGPGASFSAPSPPIPAEKLLSYLLSPERLEEVLGDFEERFRFLVHRHGAAHARRWYRWQVGKIAIRGPISALVRMAIRVWLTFYRAT
jgi:hypothetical protein